MPKQIPIPTWFCIFLVIGLGCSSILSCQRVTAGLAGDIANLDLIYVCSKHGVEYVRTYEGGITESVDKDGGPIECQP